MISQGAEAKREAMEKRAERLGQGKGGPRDLDSVFLWLRERQRSFGSTEIREIGDLISHPERREKGMMFERVSDIVTVAAFHLTRIAMTDEQIRQVDPEKAKTSLVHVAQACLRLMPRNELANIGYSNRKKASVDLTQMMDGALFKDGKSLDFSVETRREEALMLACAQTIRIVPCFEELPFRKSVFKVLIKNRLTKKIADEAAFGCHLTCYLLSKLHGTLISTPLGTHKIYVSYDPHSEEHYLNAYINFSVTRPDGSMLTSSFSVIDTTLHAGDWCEPELLINDDWPFEVEVGDNWKLGMI